MSLQRLSYGTMNYFKFENNFYHQVKGTAMGSPFAPNYANLFMGKFEMDFVYSSENVCLKCWFRYIDDVFFIFSGTVELNQFHEFLNSRLDSIRFTLEYNMSSISFLDVQVSRSTGQVLQTSVFWKPTDRNNFLHSKSYHPPSMKKSLPYSQFLPKLSTLLAPLQTLLKKEEKWPWGSGQQKAFEELKELLQSCTVSSLWWKQTSPLGIWGLALWGGGSTFPSNGGWLGQTNRVCVKDPQCS